ncbi:hypothetical protein B296_00042823 [Ensete ventricosum]|uniref:Uncharacterized protein n=1 Tax=Ensete ventricosum TaxID=4639 RepID=A0A426XKD0_ENSVE|nr:hypothetical protein B296_00042823 [Ensete ventricosum]
MRNSEASIKEVNVTANLDHDHLLAKTTLEGGDVLGDPTNRDRSLPDIRIREGEARKRRSSVGLGAIEPKDPLLENRLEDHRPGRTRSFGTLSLVHRRLIRSPTSPDPTPAPAPARARTLHDATPPPPPPPLKPPHVEFDLERAWELQLLGAASVTIRRPGRRHIYRLGLLGAYLKKNRHAS